MTVTIDDVLGLPAGATIINAGRHAGPREIRGAIRYRPAGLAETVHLALPVDREAPVVLYAEHGPDGEELEAIADHMRADGFRDVRVLGATLADYEASGGPTQEPSMEQVIPPQRPDRA